LPRVSTKPSKYRGVTWRKKSNEWQAMIKVAGKDEHLGYFDEAEDAAAHGGAAGQLGVGQTAEELAALDQKACDMCGITFFEFRNQGRLGCPHDYVQFAKELEPLIANVHGATEHTGRRPSRSPETAASAAAEGTAELTSVIGLRREMKEAILCEDYEKAKENRDAIRAIEDRWIPPARTECQE
jgi:protein-arginine kinase activator protein McsA